MNKILRSIVVVFSVCSAGAGAAERVGLEAVVAEALAKNPELKFYEAEVLAARGQRRQSAVMPSPELSAELGRKSVRDLGGNKLGDGAVWSVSIAQRFEFPGRLALRKAIADKQVELAQLGLEQFRRALGNQVRVLGYRAMAAEKRAEAAREVSTRFEDLIAVLVQRDPAGIAPLLDARIIEANALTLARRARQALQEQQSAQFELNRLRGAPIEAPLQIEWSDVQLVALPDLAPLAGQARTNNFEVRARVAELEQQGFQVRLTEHERRPAITVAPFVGGESAGDRQRQFGLGVSVPFPLKDRNRGNLDTARAREMQAEVSLAVTLRDVERRIAEAAQAYRGLAEEIGGWRPDSLGRFREAAELGDRHYRFGALPVSTYTELQKQYLDALDAILSTELEVLETRAEIEQLTGYDIGGSVAPRVTP
jgi:cobalt-zinc-cadmium efflux system outer membrane protein